MVFGVFAILGYRFSPRIADIGDTRYWRAGWPGDPDGDYGPLNAARPGGWSSCRRTSDLGRPV
jgi:hypothetical protein